MRSPIAVTLLFLLPPVIGYAGAGQQAPLVPPAPEELQNRPTNIVIRLTEQHVPAINHQVIPWNRLSAHLEAIFGLRPTKLLFYEPSPTDREQDVRQILAVAKRRGVLVYSVQRRATSP